MVGIWSFLSVSYKVVFFLLNFLHQYLFSFLFSCCNRVNLGTNCFISLVTILQGKLVQAKLNYSLGQDIHEANKAELYEPNLTCRRIMWKR
jgi:hypothetical protein